MVGYTFYESDHRVRRYAEALALHGYQVDVIALRHEGDTRKGLLNGVRVHRIQQRNLREKGKFAYLAKLLLFFVRSAIFLTREQVRERYDVIHVHSVPDFEVFAALLPKITGSKIILDIHDIVPELYADKFKTSRKSATFKLLVGVERISAAFADHVIVANHIWEQRLLGRSVAKEKLTTILNFPDTKIFRPRGRARHDSRFIAMYPGTFSYHQGVDIAVRAFALLRDKAPQAELHLYGAGEQLEFLRSQIAELGLGDTVILKKPLPADEIVSAMENADLGVVPKRADGFGNEAFSTKILEFMCLGVPVVIPDTAIDTYYFDGSIAKFFHANDERSLAEAILLLIENPELGETLARNASEFKKDFTWDVHEGTYLRLVDTLVGKNSGRS